MNIKQAVLEKLELLSSEKQQEVLGFIQSLLPSDPATQPDLRQQLVSDVLLDLQRIQRLHDGLPSAAYVNRLFCNIQTLYAQFPADPLTEVMMALHDAMAYQNHWIQYKADQYQGVYELLQELSDRPLLERQEVLQALQSLEDLGFNTLPYEITVVSDTDDNDAA
ncbi:MAG: hypothetical protein MUF49_27160 [Oculatellaceae cyanobacterium Prado106]|jgi:hypothetical protein|nr:hypothetical protein [Oculatellaceae cyanobacterium Prado106]